MRKKGLVKLSDRIYFCRFGRSRGSYAEICDQSASLSGRLPAPDSGNEYMWSSLFLCNKEALLFELNTIIDNLCKYRDAINDDDIDTLRDILRDGRERKEKSNELYAEHARRKV